MTHVQASLAYKEMSAEGKAMINGAVGKHNAKAKKIKAQRKLKEADSKTK